MNVGRRVDYAVRALSFLAGQPAGKIVSRADIEKSQDIPSFYLSKIMKDLVEGGLVQSHVGSKGGFSLAKLASNISIKDVYETYTEIDLGRGSESSFRVPGKNLDQRYRRS